MGSAGIVRHSKGFIQRTAFSSSSIALGNGDRLVNTVSIEANNDQLLLAKIYRTIWLGSRAGENWFPYGSNIDQSLYDFFNEHGVYYYLDQDAFTLSPIDPDQEQAIIVIKNNSGSSKTFIFDADVRYLMNQAGLGEVL